MSDVIIGTSPATTNGRAFPSFLLIVALAVFTGFLSQDGWPGTALALVPAALVALLAMRHDLRNLTRESKALLLLSIGSIISIALEPGPLNLGLGWTIIALLALSLHGAGFADLKRALVWLPPEAVLAPISAAKEMAGAGRTGTATIQRRNWRGIVLPLASALCFAMLLAVANPIMESILSAFTIDAFLDVFTPFASLVAVCAFPLLWLVLRMTPMKRAAARDDGSAPNWHVVYFAPSTVALTLLILNALFFMQNSIDSAYLWSGAALPPGITYAEYAQRGAASLIVTILLAAALIILALWPGSRTEASGVVRLLVYAWLLQNVFLLASTVMRTLAYIEAYGMTELRLASLVWMALIAAGLILVAIRVSMRRSNLWLVNANLAAAILLLWLSGFCDGRAIIADYNAARALYGHDVDIAYLESLGPSALPALKRVCTNGSPRAGTTELLFDLAVAQQDWKRWTIRRARIESTLAEPPLPLVVESGKLPPCLQAWPTQKTSIPPWR